MKKIATWTVLALATSLAGCGGTAYTNRSLDSVHQPVVRNAIYQFDVAAANGELPPSEQGRLQGWLDAMGVRYGDRISIEDPSVYGATSAQATVRSMVARRGLLVTNDVPVTTGAVPQDHLRVIVTRASASVPGCPNWDSKSAINIANATSSNYGCASNSNLAAMVADPNDLIKGARNAGNDPSMATRAIKTFREKPPTGAGELRGNATSNSGGGQ
ncbi:MULTISPECIES: CpaD family pilus assembly protein [unclassified Sphingopyxis]|jgi:pilus assembly protein CpaD|uniref:CpaD family pilus assembly protein n=1 Tax=unclassified Sphingopyxis TaxID=2614943 RepID=UPI00285D6C8A|nr:MULTISPECIES: CpaD family pilus assembly protein [unclassified Sphingopyxis]MDR6831861.1 pilus assembly protein CpaD [Sphingopyxis sp. BE122]MDR7227603.1 pilus assembly protein CpaD [Sphingopyxis sp. BE259]